MVIYSPIWNCEFWSKAVHQRLTAQNYCTDIVGKARLLLSCVY